MTNDENIGNHGYIGTSILGYIGYIGDISDISEIYQAYSGKKYW